MFFFKGWIVVKKALKEPKIISFWFALFFKKKIYVAVGVALLEDLLRSDGPRGVLEVVGEDDEGGPPFSLTIFLHEDNFNSSAPTFRKRSPTIFKADILAEGVKVWLCLGDDFE